MKKLLWVFLLFTVRLLAVNPVPYTESMGYSFQTDGTGTSIMTVYDEQGSSNILSTSSGSWLESGTGTAWMIPGKTYTIAFWGMGPPDYTMSFIAPTGYSVYINGVATNLVSYSPGTGWHLEYYKVELRPLAGEAGGQWGQFSGIAIGKAISWGVGLGDLRTGRSAGGIQFKEPDLSGGPATRDLLYYATPPANVGQIVVVYDGSSNNRLRQICTPIGFTDLVDVTGGYEIRCYLWSQVVSWTGTLYTFSGSPWKTIQVVSPGSSQLTITETQGSVVRVSTLTGTSGSVASGGTITTANGYTTHTFTSGGTFTASQALTSVDYLVVGGGGGGGSGVGGGGGGGGSVEYLTGQAVSSGSYTVTVGSGGAADTNGGNSSFSGTTGYGGGYGAGSSGSFYASSGGSGGGGNTNQFAASAGSGSNVYQGGGGDNGGTGWSGGGGGGAGGNTQNPSQGGGTYNGGNGLSNSISGTSTYYGGGGGGGYGTKTGGSGGGGNGGGAGGNGSAGSANSGGGGGGSGVTGSGTGGAGGSGVVIIRYRTMGQGAYTWTLQEGDGTNIARTTVHISTVPSSGQRDDVAAVYNGNSTASGDLVSKTRYHYVSQSWGEELDSVIADPDVGGAQLTTSYTYYTNSSNLGNYRRVQSVTQPTGGWTVYQYYDDWNRRGQLEYQIQPWLDSPSAASSASTTSGHVIYYVSYTSDWTGRYTRPTLREEFINNVQVGQTIWTHGDSTASGQPTATMTIKSYRDGSNYQTSYAENYRADADPDFAGEPYQTQSASQAQDSVSISRGTFNTTTKAFTVSSSGDHWREMHFHGSTNSSGADAVTGWDSQTCPSVYMIPNQSTMDVTIRIAQGYVYRTETWVYTGSGNFSLMSSVDFDYDAYGNLTQRWASNGALTNYTFTDGRLTDQLDPDGTETQFNTFDSIGRPQHTVKMSASAGTYAAQPSITTSNTYDACGHVTQSVVSGGTNSLTTTNTYDLVGRLTQTVAPGGYATGINYTSGGRVVTTTLPGGTATKVTEVYPDGHTKSVTGTSIVAQYFSYPSTIPSSGTVTTTAYIGTSGSSIWVQTTNDWLGREITEAKPAWSGGNATRTWTYDSTTGLLTKLSQTGLADTLYTYDTMGNLFRECLDVSGNDAIDLASTDRITEHNWTYFTASGNWWLRQSTSTYAGTGSTATQLGKVETQLSGLPTNRFSVTNTTDIYGNVTTQTVDVGRLGKLVTTTTTYPDSSTAAVQIAYNGLTVSSQDKANLTTTFGYDDLGRQVKSIDPRTAGTGTGSPFGTVTAYVTGANQVYTVTDAAGITQATYSYDSAGRVASTTDALGKITYFSYNDRNQVTNQWGANTYPVQYGYDTVYGWRTSMSTYRNGTGWTGSTWPSSPGTADVTQWTYQTATGLLSSKVSAYGTSDATTVNYTYTDAGQMHVRTSARSITTTYGYDAATGELTGVTYSDGTPSLTYHYNRLGKQDSVVDGTGTHTLNYNLSGTLELQSEDLPSFYGSRRITYPVATSGVIGRPTGLELGTSGSPMADESASYGYETGTGRFNSLVAGGTTLAYTYTTNSNLLASVTESVSGWTQNRTYVSNRDLLDTIETKVSTTSEAKFHYIYDNLGRRTTVNKTGSMFSPYGNGTQGLDTYYAYDDRSQLIGEKTKLGGSSTVLTGRDDGDGTTPGYAYDNIGNLSSSAGTTHNGNSANYTTNHLNQYTQRTVPGVFDVAGADTASTVTVAQSGGPTDTATRQGNYFFDGYALANSPNAVYATLTITGSGPSTLPAFLAPATESFVYDADGNLTSDGRWDYVYDAENRLVSMQTHTALSPSTIPNADAQRVEFTYDYLGRRVEKVVRGGYNGTSFVSVVSDEKFVYDGWNCMAKLNALSSNALMAAYYWGLDWSGTLQGAGGVGGLALVVDSSIKYLPMFDGNGNVMGLINAGTGSIDAAYEYDAFGQNLRESGTYAASNPWRFSTKYTDLETSLVYYGHRFYSPSLKRFLNRDPIEEQGGLNLYAFCGNNGVNRWDLLGNNPNLATSDPVAYWATLTQAEKDQQAAAALMGADDKDAIVNAYNSWIASSNSDAIANGVSATGASGDFVQASAQIASENQQAAADWQYFQDHPGSWSGLSIGPSNVPDGKVILGDATVKEYDVSLGNGKGATSSAASPGNPNAQPTASATGVASQGYTVLRVSEPAQLIGGQIASQYLNTNHQWIAVYNNGQLVGAAGLGNLRGVPGANGQSSPDSPYLTNTFVVDHSGRMNSPDITTQPIYGVDPTSVLSYINLANLNRDSGPWSLGTNDCNTWVQMVINNSTPQARELPQFTSPDTPNVPVMQQVVYPGDGTVRPPVSVTMPGKGPG